MVVLQGISPPNAENCTRFLQTVGVLEAEFLKSVFYLQKVSKYKLSLPHNNLPTLEHPDGVVHKELAWQVIVLESGFVSYPSAQTTVVWAWNVVATGAVMV